MLGFFLLYLRGMRIIMFQRSGFYFKGSSKGSFETCRAAKGF